MQFRIVYLRGRTFISLFSFFFFYLMSVNYKLKRLPHRSQTTHTHFTSRCNYEESYFLVYFEECYFLQLNLLRLLLSAMFYIVLDSSSYESHQEVKIRREQRLKKNPNKKLFVVSLFFAFCLYVFSVSCLYTENSYFLLCYTSSLSVGVCFVCVCVYLLSVTFQKGLLTDHTHHRIAVSIATSYVDRQSD